MVVFLQFVKVTRPAKSPHPMGRFGRGGGAIWPVEIFMKNKLYWPIVNYACTQSVQTPRFNIKEKHLDLHVHVHVHVLYHVIRPC